MLFIDNGEDRFRLNKSIFYRPIKRPCLVVQASLVSTCMLLSVQLCPAFSVHAQFFGDASAFKTSLFIYFVL